MSEKNSIGIIGFGNMGRAIYQMLKTTTDPKSIFIADKNISKIKGVAKKYLYADANSMVHKTNIIILAVKPQDFPALAKSLRCPKDLLVISIMAGVPVLKIKQALKVSKIVRTMPNLPLKAGKAVTGWVAAKGVTVGQKKLVKKILVSWGFQIELKDEKLLNGITALSGSGPAYFYYLAEAISAAAQKMGFAKNVAKKIAAGTLIGSAHLIENYPQNLSELRSAITSKGGTTEAAINYFAARNMPEIIAQGIEKAQKRAEQMSK